MGSLDAILSTGQQALRAHQAALQTVGQNIANVNTPGYSRVRPVLVPTEFALSGAGFRSGIEVATVERAYDRFLTAQVLQSSSTYESSQTQADLLNQLEAAFNDLQAGDAGLNGALEHFFHSFEDLANTPDGVTERHAVLQNATTVSTTVQALAQSLQDFRSGLNTTLQDQVTQVNTYTSQIAELNRQIVGREAGNQTQATSLRDQRDTLVRQVADLVGATSFETPDGQVTVLLGGGRPLVEGIHAGQLLTEADVDDAGSLRITLASNAAAGGSVDVTASVASGRLHGLATVRDTTIPELTTHLDRLAAALTRSVNTIHSTGYGLDGATGNAFFTPLQASAQVVSTNSGGGTVQSAAIFDPTQLSLDDYRINFVGAGTFDIVNARSGATVAAGQSYTAGATITFDGIAVVLNDNGTAPQIGDTFRISTTAGSARRLAVDAAVSEDVRTIAAAQTPVAGDNANALALANVRNATLLDGNTLGKFYSSVVTRLGAASQQQSTIAEQQQLVATAASNRREALAGVSLEEEQVDLIRFQQAFAAAAELIRIADEMGDTVLSLVR